MEKNYYSVLGLNENASKTDILNAIIDKLDVVDTNSDEYSEIKEASLILANETKKEEYDKKIAEKKKEQEDSKKEIIKENEISENDRLKSDNKKLRITSFILATTTILGIASAVVLSKNSKHTFVDNSLQTTITENNDVETNSQEKVLNSENFQSKVDQIVDNLDSKGFWIDRTFIESALFISNIDYLNQNDIKDLYGKKDINIIEEIENMYKYVSAVRTHNNNNKAFISLTDLVYDEEDFEIISTLENNLIDLKTKVNSNLITEEEYLNSFDNITGFYTGVDYIETNNNKYTYYSMTSGGGLLAELYWPMYAVAYRASEHQNSKVDVDIQTLSTEVIDGSRFLGGIIQHENVTCLDGYQKVLK